MEAVIFDLDLIHFICRCFFKYQIKRCDENEHDQHGVEREVPVEDPWADLQNVQDLKDDQLEHGAREGEVDAEDELDEDVSELIVFEQLFHEKDPTNHEEHQLGGQHRQGIGQQSHLELI